MGKNDKEVACGCALWALAAAFMLGMWCQPFLMGDDDDDEDFEARVREVELETERDEERERQQREEERIHEEYETYLDDMARLDWEMHCTSVMYSLGPPPPDFRNGHNGKFAWQLVGETASYLPRTIPKVHVKTFEEFITHP